MAPLLQELAIKVSDTLQKQHLKLATAESCTGGGLGYWLTNISGSSKWFECGFITYSDSAKVRMLGVNPLTIKAYGAVSAEAAREMAEGALKNSEADISIAITGIAGPTGGTTLKPIGTVWIGWAKRGGKPDAHLAICSGDREAIRTQAMEKALMKLVEIV